MRKLYRTYVAQTAGELADQLGWMMLYSPTFADKTGSFPEHNIDHEFKRLHEALDLLRPKLGAARYAALVEMADRMKAHFLADPEDKTEDALAGRQIIVDMMDVLSRKRKV